MNWISVSESMPPDGVTVVGLAREKGLRAVSLMHGAKPRVYYHHVLVKYITTPRTAGEIHEVPYWHELGRSVHDGLAVEYWFPLPEMPINHKQK